jgi:hypothetical protein
MELQATGACCEDRNERLGSVKGGEFALAARPSVFQEIVCPM